MECFHLTGNSSLLGERDFVICPICSFVTVPCVFCVLCTKYMYFVLWLRTFQDREQSLISDCKVLGDLWMEGAIEMQTIIIF